MNITMEFARQDDCLDKMVPSDLRQLIGDKERAEEQCKALAAQVEVLRKPLQSMVELMDCGDESGAGSKWHAEATTALSATPTACLAQVRAEAGRAGFIAGTKLLMGDRETNADQYAKRILQGGTK